jgi:hypothetical protein
MPTARNLDTARRRLNSLARLPGRMALYKRSNQRRTGQEGGLLVVGNHEISTACLPAPTSPNPVGEPCWATQAVGVYIPRSTSWLAGHPSRSRSHSGGPHHFAARSYRAAEERWGYHPKPV